jgi:hypothetical protein
MIAVASSSVVACSDETGSTVADSGSSEVVDDAASSDAASMTTPEAATSSEAASCALAATDGGTCNAITQSSPLVTSTCSSDPLPATTGGVVEDGVYVLDALTYYAGQCPPSPDSEHITWVVCGTQWELAEDILSTDGGVQVVRLNLDRPTQGNMVSSNITCQPGTPLPRMAPPQSYTASPGKFVVQIDSGHGTRVDSFHKM